MAGDADEVFEAADLIVKVKEPVPEEYDRFRRDRNSSPICTSLLTRN